MALRFEVLGRFNHARAAQLTLPHFVCQTPLFMPVGTQGTIKGLATDQLEEIGCQIILGNTYHLALRPTSELIDEMGGIHKFMNWPRAMLTDSGGFQMVSLLHLADITEKGVTFQSPVDGKPMLLTPEESIQIQLRCACHIINLIVKDGIEELEDGIEAIWHCVKFIRSSSSRLDKFREFSILENMNKNANVPLDVITRWNNTYLMLDAALKYEKMFDRMSYDDPQFKAYIEEADHKGKKRVGPPCEDDWRNSQAFVHFLGKFYESTLKMSAWKHVTAHLLFTEMILLQTEIKKKIADRRDPVLQRVAEGMKAKFDKYCGSFEGINKIILIANILDPRWKLHYQKVALEMVGMLPEKVVAIIAELKIILMRMYDKYRICDPASSQTNTGDGVAAMDLEVEPGNDILAHVMQERRNEQRVMINHEVDRYSVDQYVNSMTKGFDIALWWKVNANAYPILSKLAKDILAIPCSIVASENAFSLGKRVVDPFRSSLTPQMVEALVCTSDWVRAEQPNFYK